jgi:hypothetical protein
MKVAVTIEIVLRKDLEDRVHGGDITMAYAAELQLNEKPHLIVVGAKEL